MDNFHIKQALDCGRFEPVPGLRRLEWLAETVLEEQLDDSTQENWGEVRLQQKGERLIKKEWASEKGNLRGA